MSIHKYTTLQPGERYDFEIKQLHGVNQLILKIVPNGSRYTINALSTLIKIKNLLASGKFIDFLGVIEQITEEIFLGCRKKVYQGSWFCGASLCLNLEKVEYEYRVISEAIKIRKKDPKQVLHIIEPKKKFKVLPAEKSYFKLKIKEGQLEVWVKEVKNGFTEFKKELQKIAVYVDNEKCFEHADILENVAEAGFLSYRRKAISWLNAENKSNLSTLENLYKYIIETIKIRQENRLNPPGIFPFPYEVTNHILSFLAAKDLSGMLKVNRTANTMIYSLCDRRAAELNYRGPVLGANTYQYLRLIPDLLGKLVNDGYINIDFISFDKGNILIEDTLKKIQDINVDSSILFTHPANSPTVLHKWVDELSKKGNLKDSKLLEKEILLMMEWGVDINSQDSVGNTLLHSILSIPHASDELILAVIEVGSDVNLSNNLGNTPLHLTASFRKSEEIFKAIVNKTKNINHANQAGDTPLLLVIFHKMIYPLKNSICLLLEKGANADYQNPDNGNTVFHCLAHNYIGEKVGICSYKLKDWGNRYEVEQFLYNNTHPATYQLRNKSELTGKNALDNAHEEYCRINKPWEPSPGRSWGEWK